MAGQRGDVMAMSSAGQFASVPFSNEDVSRSGVVKVSLLLLLLGSCYYYYYINNNNREYKNA